MTFTQYKFYCLVLVVHDTYTFTDNFTVLRSSRNADFPAIEIAKLSQVLRSPHYLIVLVNVV